MRGIKRWIAAFLISTFCTAGSAAAQAGTQDGQLQADVTKALNKRYLQNVQAAVQNGTVVLSGNVATFADKQEADKRAHHVKNVKGVDNEIEVSAGEVDDATLQRQLVQKISYDRVGYGTTPFNAISVSVQNGVATLSGTAYGPVDRDSALSVAANTKGVRDVVDEVQVDPLSPNDDRIRLAVYRSLYGFPSLSKYAIDPAKPIRISVANGNVTLYGVVDTQADKDTANIRANGVSGVFKVTNNLQVADQGARGK